MLVAYLRFDDGCQPWTLQGCTLVWCCVHCPPSPHPRLHPGPCLCAPWTELWHGVRGRKLPCTRSHSLLQNLWVPVFWPHHLCNAESLSPGLHFCASESRGPVSPAPQLEWTLSSGPVGKGQHSDLPPDMIRLMSKKSDEFQVHFVLKDSSAFSATSVKPLCPSSASAHEPTYPCWAG